MFLALFADLVCLTSHKNSLAAVAACSFLAELEGLGFCDALDVTDVTLFA